MPTHYSTHKFIHEIPYLFCILIQLYSNTSGRRIFAYFTPLYIYILHDKFLSWWNIKSCFFITNRICSCKKSCLFSNYWLLQAIIHRNIYAWGCLKTGHFRQFPNISVSYHPWIHVNNPQPSPLASYTAVPCPVTSKGQCD